MRANIVFLCIHWERGPIESPELVKLCESRLGWKKSKTYTVIKKLSNKGNVLAFLAAFLKDRLLSKEDIVHIKKIIEDAGEDD